ncbi:MAG: hypothetical protein IT165_24645 [Bryobacterales bacterium]|nr:hypothetical protein [Bryobacterales bacterium]
MRLLLLGFLTLSAFAGTSHLRIGGEWCFLSYDSSAPHADAVILIHGNGQTVDEKSSSWERDAGSSLLMARLRAAGFLLAQSNHSAIPGNGMWGNAATQAAVLSLIRYVREKYQPRRIHAIAVSAGNVTLLNLALDRKVVFHSAVLMAPVISLESMYTCPAGVDRVAGLARAFSFKPSHGCPGDPKDPAFVKATARFDPLRRARTGGVDALSGTRWMAVYEESDAKVPPGENIEPLRSLIPIKPLTRPGATHASRELFETYADQIVQFLKEK